MPVKRKDDLFFNEKIKPYNDIVRTLRSISEVNIDGVNEIKDRVKKAKYRYSKYDNKYFVDGVPAWRCLKGQKEKTKFIVLAKKYGDEIDGLTLLIKVICGNRIRYKGKNLKDYFDDNVEYMRAVNRIRRGWDVDEAIARRKEVIDFSENGKRSFKKIMESRGFSKKQTVYYLYNIACKKQNFNYLKEV